MTRKKKKEKAKTVPVSKPPNKKMAGLLKQIDKAFFTFRFYPVAVKADTKKEAAAKIKQIYNTGNDTVRQFILYQFHEHLAKSEELKIVHTTDFFRRKTPSVEPSKLRIQVYRAIFHYNYSLEGLLELIQLLGELNGDDAAKLLTYHFSFFSAIETEATHMLRNAVIDALALSSSPYAVYALLRYARLTDHERLLQRILNGLEKWDKKLDTLSIPTEEKQNLHREISRVLTIEFGDTHYG